MTHQCTAVAWLAHAAGAAGRVIPRVRAFTADQRRPDAGARGLPRSARARGLVAGGAGGGDAARDGRVRGGMAAHARRRRSARPAGRRVLRPRHRVPPGARAVRRRRVVAAARRRSHRTDGADHHLCHGRSGLPADGEAERLRGEPAMASLLRRHRQRLAIVARRAQGLRGEPRMSESPRDGAVFMKVLGLRDVILMNVVAVVGMRWIARGARTGPESVPLWILAWIAFLVPHAVAISSLARKYPEQGGIYAWTRRAFGPGHGFVCGWFLWVNNLFYFPSLLLFGAANFAAIGGEGWHALGSSRAFSVAFVLGGIWLAAGISIIGLRWGKWLENAGVMHHGSAWGQVAADRRPARRVNSRRHPDRLRRAGGGPLRIGDPVHRADDDAGRDRARHAGAVVGDVLRLFRLRDHRPGRTGGEGSAAHHPDRHRRRRHRDDAGLHRRLGVGAGRGAGVVAEGIERHHRRRAARRGTRR